MLTIEISELLNLKSVKIFFQEFKWGKEGPIEIIKHIKISNKQTN